MRKETTSEEAVNAKLGNAAAVLPEGAAEAVRVAAAAATLVSSAEAWYEDAAEAQPHAEAADTWASGLRQELSATQVALRSETEAAETRLITLRDTHTKEPHEVKVEYRVAIDDNTVFAVEPRGPQDTER